jgi:hypothetical protein
MASYVPQQNDDYWKLTSMDTNRYLIEEPPILVMPSLAVALGLSEAIILQQLHYWLQRSNNERDNRRWVYNTIKDWEVQFPFWSGDTIKRTMRTLRDQGIIITANYNSMPMDRTLWYSIDYEVLDTIVQKCPTISAKRPNGSGQVAPSNNQRLPDTNKDDDDDVTSGKVFKLFENVMPGSLTEFIATNLNQLIDTYGCKEVYSAIEKAGKANARSISYIEQICINRAAGKDKPQKEQSNGSNRRAGSGSTRPVSSANAAYVIPGT